ncbi:MAG: MFS transporter [Gaiella sp.]
MRRTVGFLSSVVFFDAMLFGALIPLVPRFADELGLSKLEAGLLVGAYGAGSLLFGIPAGMIAARIGFKRSIVIGMAVVAVSSVGFALAGNLGALMAARFVQGCGSVFTWTAALGWIAIAVPREKRGQALGTAFGIAVFGFVIGPLVGALGDAVSIRTTYLVVAAVAVAIGALTAFRSDPAAPRTAPGALGKALADRRFVGGLWLNTLPALFFGTLDVLAPLDLDAGGFGAAGIGLVFFVAGITEVGANPLIGRLSDRRGPFLPVQLGLGAAVLVSLALVFVSSPYALAALIAAASVAYGGFYTPGMALIADRADDLGLAQGTSFGITNTAWALGAMLGPWVGGALGHAAGDWLPYLCCGALCAATLTVMRRRRHVPQPLAA